jgi:hypothetical protein
MLFHQVSLPGLTRVSLGIENSAADVDTLIQVLDKIARQPRSKADRPVTSPQTDIKKQMNDFAGTVARRVYP